MHPVKKIVLTANYWNKNYKEVIWLIGDGRSGTTWLSDLINHDNRYRSMFEPFHSQSVKFLKPHQYMRPDAANKPLEKMASDVFSGKYTGRRVDRYNHSFVYKGLLIKDIFANLFACWASVRFPNIKIVLLIRNPFSVALSKLKKKGAFWAVEPLEFLEQHSLYEDYLLPFENLIRETSGHKDFILSQILIWAIVNYIPLRQFKPGQIHMVFYEDLYAQPDFEISKISRFIRPGAENRQIKLDRHIVNQPSRVSGAQSNLTLGLSPVTSWKNELTSRKIDAGLRILESFGFEQLYNDNSMPDKNEFNKIKAIFDQKKPCTRQAYDSGAPSHKNL